MTATDSLLSHPNAIALLAAIDGGDDSALLPLADVMEECGDERAAGLRLASRRKPSDHYGFYGWRGTYRHFMGDNWLTYKCQALWGSDRWDVPSGEVGEADDVYQRLEGWVHVDSLTGKHYTSRSTAFLALAAALIPQE